MFNRLSGIFSMNDNKQGKHKLECQREILEKVSYIYNYTFIFTLKPNSWKSRKHVHV